MPFSCSRSHPYFYGSTMHGNHPQPYSHEHSRVRGRSLSPAHTTNSRTRP